MSPSETKGPATNRADAFNRCDPAVPLPAGDERYVDLAAGRGEEGSAVAKCRECIQLSSTPLVQLLAGHRGCGKSTELRRLERDLEGDGFFVAYFEADVDLDLEDTEPVDVLLAVIRNLEAALRAKGIRLAPKLLDDFLLWFGEVVLEKTERKAIEAEVQSEIGLGADVPLFGRFLARLTGQIKTGTESKRNVRQKLDPQISQLLERGRLLVTAARAAVRKAGKKDLVVIADNLDRIAFKDRGDGRTSHEVLFVDRGDLLKKLGCHTVITVPISLLFSPKLANLIAIFPDRHVLPMVKIAQRSTRKPWKKGRQLLADLIGHRIDLGTLFAKGAVDDLVTMSGGHPRILMILVRYALVDADEPPVTRKVVARAFRRLVDDYGRSIPEEHWPLLARVAREQTVRNDEAHQLMLFNMSVLEYQNAERWCDVHPAVRELAPFKAALARLAAEGGDDAPEG